MSKPLRVLIIEDSEMDALLVLYELKRGGYEPTLERVETAEAMQAALDTREWDVIISDYTLPRFSGLAALKLLCESGRDLPFIILSGTISEETAVGGMKAGAHDYIMKNNIKRLVPAIERELSEVKVRQQRKQAEEALAKHTHELNERVKELSCLYDICNLTDRRDISFEAMLKGIVELIPSGWQYPEVTCDKIVLEDEEYTTANFKETVWKQADDIIVHGNIIGSIEIYYLEEMPESDEGPFLKDERNLLHAIAKRIGDIIERRWAHEALIRSEVKYRSLVNNVRLGIFRSTTGQKGRFLEVNPAMEEITGYSRDELLEMDVSSLYLYPEERLDILDKVSSTVGQVTQEFSLRKKDGTEILISDTKVAVRDSTGKIAFFDGIMEDITERKQVEQRIKHLNTVLRALRDVNQLITQEKDKERLIQRACKILVEARGYGIAWILLLDDNGNFVSAAGAGAGKELSGFLKQMKQGKYPQCVREILAKKESVITYEDVRNQHKECFLADCLTGGVSLVGRLESGDRVYGVISVNIPHEVVVDEEEMALFQEIAGDISHALANIEKEEQLRIAEEKAREAEVMREVNRLRSELMANVSHELRTPLASIKGFASTLLQPDVKWTEEEQRDFLTTIDHEADRLSRIINDLLDMSRLEAGAMELGKRSYRITEVLESVSSRLDKLTEHHKLQVKVSPELPPVLVDEMRIGQVLANLVENAAKFSKEGSPITIEAQRAKDKVVVSVTDRGYGIPAELMDKVFDRFYQTESIVTGRKKGTGLGLSICRGVIEAHGGEIWVESRVGEGSKFSFSLPLSEEE